MAINFLYDLFIFVWILHDSFANMHSGSQQWCTSKLVVYLYSSIGYTIALLLALMETLLLALVSLLRYLVWGGPVLTPVTAII